MKEIDKSEESDIEMTGEDNSDEIELEEHEGQLEKKIKQLRTKLKACEAEKQTHLDDLQRAKAEFLNTKKRLSEQAALETDRGIDTHVVRLLPLCDSFDMAMANKETWDAIDESWRIGVEAINNQLRSILKSYDVEEVTSSDETFDPEKHEAMSAVDSDEHETDQIIEVLQKGYMRKGKIIRPAKVILSN